MPTPQFGLQSIPCCHSSIRDFHAFPKSTCAVFELCSPRPLSIPLSITLSSYPLYYSLLNFLSLYFSLSYFLLFACLHPLKINFQYLCFLLGLEHQSLTLVGNAQLLYPPGRPQQNTLATRQATIETSLSPGVQTRTYMLRFSLYRQINLGELRWVGTRR